MFQTLETMYFVCSHDFEAIARQLSRGSPKSLWRVGVSGSSHSSAGITYVQKERGIASALT